MRQVGLKGKMSRERRDRLNKRSNNKKTWAEKEGKV